MTHSQWALFPVLCGTALLAYPNLAAGTDDAPSDDWACAVGTVQRDGKMQTDVAVSPIALTGDRQFDSTTTDSQGSFCLDLPWDGEFALRLATAYGELFEGPTINFSMAQRGGTCSNGSTCQALGAIELVPQKGLTATWCIAEGFVNLPDGTPAANAIVSANDVSVPIELLSDICDKDKPDESCEQVTTTDEAGYFSFSFPTRDNVQNVELFSTFSNSAGDLFDISHGMIRFDGCPSSTVELTLDSRLVEIDLHAWVSGETINWDPPISVDRIEILTTDGEPKAIAQFDYAISPPVTREEFMEASIFIPPDDSFEFEESDTIRAFPHGPGREVQFQYCDPTPETPQVFARRECIVNVKDKPRPLPQSNGASMTFFEPLVLAENGQVTQVLFTYYHPLHSSKRGLGALTRNIIGGFHYQTLGIEPETTSFTPLLGAAHSNTAFMSINRRVFRCEYDTGSCDWVKFSEPSAKPNWNTSRLHYDTHESPTVVLTEGGSRYKVHVVGVPNDPTNLDRAIGNLKPRLFEARWTGGKWEWNDLDQSEYSLDPSESGMPGARMMNSKYFMVTKAGTSLERYYKNRWRSVNRRAPGNTKLRGPPMGEIDNRKHFMLSSNGSIWEQWWDGCRWKWQEHPGPYPMTNQWGSDGPRASNSTPDERIFFTDRASIWAYYIDRPSGGKPYWRWDEHAFPEWMLEAGYRIVSRQAGVGHGTRSVFVGVSSPSGDRLIEARFSGAPSPSWIDHGIIPF